MTLDVEEGILEEGKNLKQGGMVGGIEEDNLEEDVVEEGRLQEGKLEESNLKMGRLQEGRLHEGSFEEGKLQEGKLPFSFWGCAGKVSTLGWWPGWSVLLTGMTARLTLTTALRAPSNGLTGSGDNSASSRLCVPAFFRSQEPSSDSSACRLHMLSCVTFSEPDWKKLIRYCQKVGQTRGWSWKENNNTHTHTYIYIYKLFILSLLYTICCRTALSHTTGAPNTASSGTRSRYSFLPLFIGFDNKERFPSTVRLSLVTYRCT